MRLAASTETATSTAAAGAEARAVDETHSNVVQQKRAVALREGVAKWLRGRLQLKYVLV